MTDAKVIEANSSQNNNEKAIINDVKFFSIWTLVLTIYLLLLISIGYIAFWNQDFNDPEQKVGAYIKVLSAYKKATGVSEQNLSHDQFVVVIQEIMKKDADAAGDLQELASQSFHILLGGILAFLSASATMVFQRIGDKRRHT